MIPTNVRNKQLAKKKRARKAKNKVIVAPRELTKKQKYYLEVVAAQRIKELEWRISRIEQGLSWACGFDKKGNIYAVKGRAANARVERQTK